jgi:DNA-nicking Smr family endonuclease
MMWDRVVKSVTPLRGRANTLPEIENFDDRQQKRSEQDLPLKTKIRQNSALKPYTPPVSGAAERETQRPARLDEVTARKLKKGKLRIHAQIDLHGLSQHMAHSRLRHFLEQAQQHDFRIVLVITGKGRGGDGVLRQLVPRWLDEPAFSNLAGSWREAHIGHGGEGALYIRIRRKRSD